jgi:hypothetical protein
MQVKDRLQVYIQRPKKGLKEQSQAGSNQALKLGNITFNYS